MSRAGKGNISRHNRRGLNRSREQRQDNKTRAGQGGDKKTGAYAGKGPQGAESTRKGERFVARQHRNRAAGMWIKRHQFSNFDFFHLDSSRGSIP